jgi:hypothetical protein
MKQSRIRIFFAVILFLLPLGVIAQSCSDSDNGKTYNIRGTTSSITIDKTRLTKIDECVNGGNSLTEYFCAYQGASSSTTVTCEFGCLDGACITPTSRNAGCFITFKLKIARQLPTSPIELSLEEVIPSVDGIWDRIALPLKDRAGEGVVIETYDYNNKLVGQYVADVVGEFSDRKQVITSTTPFYSRVILTFRPNVAAVVFKAAGAKLRYALRPAERTCLRPCIRDQQGGREGIEGCCSGYIKQRINPEMFVCEPQPSSSPTPSPTFR